MTDAQFDKLVTSFRELMAKGDKDQWKLAEMAWTASENHGGIARFAKATGYAANTISTYAKAFAMKQADHSDSLVFADAAALAKMSPERGEAVQVLAGAMGRAINTTSKDSEAVSLVQDFLAENPELVTEALKDDDTRSTVVAAAFKAASEGMATEVTTGGKPKPMVKRPVRNTTSRAAEVERLKLSAAMTARWANGNLPALVRDTQALAEYMTQDELQLITDHLATASEAITAALNTIGALVKAAA